MQEILIDKIRTDGEVQSRERINDEYVKELSELVKSGKRLPPCDVYNDGVDIWMADGFHRLLAHLDARKRTIRCEVHKGTQTDAVWASCGANLAHGLRRTNADKRHAVELALKTKPELSDQAIADHAGVSHEFVRQIKNAVRQVGNRCQPEKVTGTDGKTYPARKIRPPWEVAAVQGAQASTSIPTTPANRPPAGQTVSRPPPPATPPPTKAAIRTDEVGYPIPDHLLPLFDRAPEVQALLGQLSSVKGALKCADTAGDVLYSECNMQAALAGIQTAYDAIKATTPYAVCPWCHGTLSDECAGCGHRGVLGKFRWDTIVPRELKK